MPNLYKSFREMSFADLGSVWRQTYESLQSADEIVAVGYSFRDLHFDQLLHEAVRSRSSPTPMTVVTKSERGQRRIEAATDWINIDVANHVTVGLETYAKTLN